MEASEFFNHLIENGLLKAGLSLRIDGQKAIGMLRLGGLRIEDAHKMGQRIGREVVQ